MTDPIVTSKLGTVRERFAAKFRGLRGASGESFARAVIEPEAQTGRLVCWGELARQFHASFTSDEQWLDALSVFVEERDLRALLLFVHASRTRAAVRDALLARASELPITIQRALLTMIDPSSVSSAVIETLSPSAQQLLADGEDALKREREVVEARIAELLSFGIVGADSVDPRIASAEGNGVVVASAEGGAS